MESLDINDIYEMVKRGKHLYIPGRAQGKERHTKSGSSTLRTRAYEREYLGAILQDWHGENPPLTSPIGMRVIQTYKSLEKKPDIDNVIKALFDAMIGIVIADDKQILYLETYQQPTNQFTEENLTIRVRILKCKLHGLDFCSCYS